MRQAWLILLLGLTLLCGADPKPENAEKEGDKFFFIRFYSDPPGATVNLNGYGPLGEADGRPLAVPRGKPLYLFEFRLDGYKGEQITTISDSLNHRERLPEGEEPLHLKPASLRAHLRANVLPLALLALALGAVAATLLGTRRARKLEALLATAEHTSLTGAKLGRYRLLDRLGRGGMARVYRALPADELEADKAVAVKILQAEMAEDPEMRKRFGREVRMCQQLDHPGIVRIHDWGEDGDLVYLVMELVEGGTLRERIEQGGLEPAEVLGQMFQAVAYAHSRGVVHRDLKPENVMLTARGRVKLMDFGLGKEHNSTNLTQSGAILGTPAYMAPEQIQGVGFEQGTDQYALGVIAFELLTGRQPFQADDPVQLLFKHVAEEPPPAGISPAVDAVLARMLAKSPAHRYPTVEEAGRALLEAM